MNKKQEHIALIREKAIEANPEIVSLKIGCLLDLYCGESAGLAYIVALCGVCPKHKTFAGCEKSENDCEVDDGVFAVADTDEGYYSHTIKLEDIKPYQILGRPVRLADVLLAIKKEDAMVNKGGQLLHYAGETESLDGRYRGFYVKHYTPTITWNLRKDSLEDQSDECLQFLSDLLLPDKKGEIKS